MEKQLEIYDRVIKYRDEIRKEIPAILDAHAAFRDEVYKDGALSHKVKRLIALGIALRCECEGCIVAHTKNAVMEGATKAELMEAVAIAIIMSGTPAMAESWRVVKTLEEMGRW